MQINIEKKHFYGILGFLILISCGFVIYAGVDTTKAYHDASSVQIVVDGVTTSLQEAIDSGSLGGDSVIETDPIWLNEKSNYATEDYVVDYVANADTNVGAAWTGTQWTPNGTEITIKNGNYCQGFARVNNGVIEVRATYSDTDTGWINNAMSVYAGSCRAELIFGGLEVFYSDEPSVSVTWLGEESGILKVICTEMWSRGEISDEWYNADVDFAEKYIDEITMAGYHAWAKPLVRVEQENEEVYQMVKPIAYEWARQMAYYADIEDSGSSVGQAITKYGIARSKEIGELLDENGLEDYEIDEEVAEKIAYKYLTLYAGKDLSTDEYLEDVLKDMENLFDDIVVEIEKDI